MGDIGATKLKSLVNDCLRTASEVLLRTAVGTTLVNCILLAAIYERVYKILLTNLLNSFLKARSIIA